MKQEKQYRQHAKEAVFLTFLEKYCASNGIEYKDVHSNTKTGIDIYLNGKPYDLKVSNSYKLSLFRKSDYYKEGWRCPILEHRDVDYMYVVEKDDRYIGFCINKEDLLSATFLSGTAFTTYTGDGNVNVNVDLKGQITDLAYEIMTFEK